MGESDERAVAEARDRSRRRIAKRRRKVSQVIASEIVREIIDNKLEAGDRLATEAELVDQFDVGRASVREALRILEGYGLVSIRQGQSGGPVVASLRPEDLSRSLAFYFHITGATYDDLIGARLLIEPVMARLAAERQSPAHIEQLREVADREQRAGFEDAEYIAAADEFHYVVSGMSGNRALDLLGRGLRTLYQARIVEELPALGPEQRPHNRETHRRIADAILAQDGERAEQLMEEHLRELAEALFERTPALRNERIIWEG
jgi:GntR family transcriptional repressor for pyruvate dehydrogenase complex